MKIIQKLRVYLINNLNKFDKRKVKITDNYREELKQCDQRRSAKEEYLRDTFSNYNAIIREELITEPYPKVIYIDCKDQIYKDISESQFSLFWKIHLKLWEFTYTKLEELAQINLKERNKLRIKFENTIKEEYAILEKVSLLKLMLLWLSERGSDLLKSLMNKYFTRR